MNRWQRFLLLIPVAGILAGAALLPAVWASVRSAWQPLAERGWSLPLCLARPDCYGWWARAAEALYHQRGPYPHPLWVAPTLVLGGALAASWLWRWLTPQWPIYTARWARPGDTRPLILHPRPAHQAELGIPLALAHGRVVGLKLSRTRRELGHVLACAPSRAGKGLWLTYVLLTWPSSAVVLDPKGELYRLTAGYRRTFGPVFAFCPDGRGHRYDPIAELDASPEALKAAALLVLRPEQDRENAVFAQRAAMLLSAMFRSARAARRPALAEVRALLDLGPFELVRRLDAQGNPDVRRWVRDFLLRDPREFRAEDLNEDRFLSSAWGTLLTRLDPLLSDGVLRATGGMDFHAADFTSSPATLYLIFGEAELEHTQAVLQLVLLALALSWLRAADAAPDQERLPILLALDEAGRVPVPRLPDLVSTVAGRGLSVLTVVQSLAQLQDAYGPAGAHTILANSHAHLYWSTNDLRTAEDLARLLGQQSVPETRYSRRVGALQPDPVRMTALRPRELLTPDEFRQIPKDHLVAIVGECPPILGRRLDWRCVPWLRRLVHMPPPPLPPLSPPPKPSWASGSAPAGTPQLEVLD